MTLSIQQIFSIKNRPLSYNKQTTKRGLIDINKKKELGQVFTPEYIVENMLEEFNESLLKSKILEPSFGDGAFLIKIIENIIKIGINNDLSKGTIIDILKNNVFGVELDSILYKNVLKKIETILNKYNLPNTKLNLYNMNFFEYLNEDKFDIIIGNPPYKKIKKEEEVIKDSIFKKGNMDMYIYFFEHSLNLLKDTGKLSFITPNSYITNKSFSKFREHLIKENLLDKILDFKSNLIFKDVLTYTCITILNKNKKSNDFQYINLENIEKTTIKTLNLGSFNKNPWIFAEDEDLLFLDNINKSPYKLLDYCDVQNGLATNKDNLYIYNHKNENILENEKIEDGLLKNIIKIASFDKRVIIFPYILDNGNYKLIEEEDLIKNYPNGYKFLLKYKDELLKRDLEKGIPWYGFARSQGLKNLNKDKILIKRIFNPKDSLEFNLCDKDLAAYSGLYLTMKENANFKLEYILNVLKSDDFKRYCILKGKLIKGGYVYINTRILKEYKFN